MNFIEKSKERGKRKDQCQNCSYACNMRYTPFGRFLTCGNPASKTYFDRDLPYTKPTCQYVHWKPLDDCTKFEDKQPYIGYK